MEPRKASLSKTIKSELLLPNDTNTLNTLMGGRLMHWMDIVAGISAQKHSNAVVVTAAVDNISFKNPILLGQVITLEAQVTRSFNTSMEVFIRVFAEDMTQGGKIESNTAFFTFVALDKNGIPKKVPGVIPENDEEKRLYEGALLRREERLKIAKRM